MGSSGLTDRTFRKPSCDSGADRGLVACHLGATKPLHAHGIDGVGVGGDGDGTTARVAGLGLR